MHVVITGAAGGIGRALARQYASEANRLTLVDRDAAGLEAVAASITSEVRVAPVDLGDLETCCDFLDDAEAEYGPVDVLISNAAIGYIESALEVSGERVEHLFRVNTLAPIRLMERVLPQMVSRGQGAIITVASLLGLLPAPHQAHYSASKSAVGAYSEALRGELLKTGVKVLTVYPGPIATDMDRRVKEKLIDTPRLDGMKVGAPEGLAAAIQRASEKGKARIVYPQRYGIARLFYTIALWATVNFPIPLRNNASS